MVHEYTEYVSEMASMTGLNPKQGSKKSPLAHAILTRDRQLKPEGPFRHSEYNQEVQMGRR